MKLTSRFVFFSTLTGCLQPKFASAFELDATFDAIVEQLLLELHVPGISIAVIDGINITTKVSPPATVLIHTADN